MAPNTLMFSNMWSLIYNMGGDCNIFQVRKVSENPEQKSPNRYNWCVFKFKYVCAKIRTHAEHANNYKSLTFYCPLEIRLSPIWYYLLPEWCSLYMHRDTWLYIMMKLLYYIIVVNVTNYICTGIEKNKILSISYSWFVLQIGSVY